MDGAPQLSFWPLISTPAEIEDEWPVESDWLRSSFSADQFVVVPPVMPEAPKIRLFYEAAKRVPHWLHDAHKVHESHGALVLLDAFSSSEHSSSRQYLKPFAPLQLVSFPQAARGDLSLDVVSYDLPTWVARRALVDEITEGLFESPSQETAAEEAAEALQDPREFEPSVTLVSMVRDGLRSHTESASSLIDPHFVSEGLSLLTDEEIRGFMSTRLWRLILTAADRAIVEGKTHLRLGDASGFSEQIDHQIVERIPIAPKNISLFLSLLYVEFRAFVGQSRELPNRGTLHADDTGLYCSLAKLAMPQPIRNPDVEIIFE